VQEMSAEQRAQAMDMQRKIVPISMRVAPPIVMVLYYLVIGGVLLFVFNNLMGGSLKFKEALNITTYASLPPSIVSMALSVLVLYLKPVEDYDIQAPLASNLGAFLSVESVGKFVHSLAASIDAFTIWSIVLLGIGFSTAIGVKKLPTGKAITTIGGLWLVWVLGKAMLATIF